MHCATSFAHYSRCINIRVFLERKFWKNPFEFLRQIEIMINSIRSIDRERERERERVKKMINTTRKNNIYIQEGFNNFTN